VNKNSYDSKQDALLTLERHHFFDRTGQPKARISVKNTQVSIDIYVITGDLPNAHIKQRRMK
jgi:hypothetical protein